MSTTSATIFNDAYDIFDVRDAFGMCSGCVRDAFGMLPSLYVARLLSKSDVSSK